MAIRTGLPESLLMSHLWSNSNTGAGIDQHDSEGLSHDSWFLAQLHPGGDHRQASGHQEHDRYALDDLADRREGEEET
jgi:hypothetical protein